LIDIIDIPVALVFSALALGALTIIAPAAADSRGAVLLLLGCVWFAYFVVLKHSRVRTVGYMVAGARIVNLKGERPRMASLLARLLFAVVGPFNFLLDLLWITGDPNRQALRDKFARTYVIRTHASPAGAGTIVHRTYMVWGMTFLFQEVKPGRAP